MLEAANMTKDVQIGIRVSQTLADALDAKAAEMTRLVGITPSRTQVVVSLLERALGLAPGSSTKAPAPPPVATTKTKKAGGR